MRGSFVKSSGIAVSATLIACLFPKIGLAAPIVPGLHGKHPLSEVQVGELLIRELQCRACHGAKAASSLDKKAPDLSDVGSRVAPEYLRRFIASPSIAHSGTTMPDVLNGKNEDERNRIAEAITQFLVARSPRKFQREAIAEKDASIGKSLFATVGCVACHSPRDEVGKEVLRDGVVNLEHLAAKYSVSSLSEFLYQPLRVRPSGRMPDMKLTPDEARAIASSLLGKADAKAPAFPPNAELAALGEKYFKQLNCAACHSSVDMPAAPALGDLRDARPDRGCLAKSPTASPHFHLDEDQIKAIRAAIAKAPEPASDKTQLAATLTTLNCIACHIRDDFGGVPAERNLLFQSDAKNLGDDARIPPPLTLAGARMNPAWIKKVLFDGASVRPYMFTRMPQYGESNLKHVPELFAKLDKVEHVELSIPNGESPNKKDRERSQEMREAGRKLLGNKSLNCVACHNFNGKTPQNNGIELMTSHERLQPSWFYHFLCNPNAFRPRTVMPAAWPDGKGVDTTVFGGDAKRQIEAIWYYLSLGTSAPDPSGVVPVETKIVVTDAARTYRGRSSVAGYRGIAVGLPEKLSYAFNAETGTLSALWRGEFVRVDRGGQGSGGFQPASKHVALAQDVSFFALPDEKSPWPLRPVMTKEQRVNLDPLYPKNRGYQFKGYYLDDASVPTFMYRTGEIEIEDRSVAASASDDGRLVRTLTFDSPKAQTTWFRALTGKIESNAKQSFENGDLRIRIPAAPTLVRPTAADAGVSELLLKLDIPQGRSSLTFTYELLK